MMLWCDGLKTELTKPSTSQTRKHGVGSDNESGEEECLGNGPKKRKTAEKGREEKVEEIVSTLKKKHGKLYTQMQYRIWGEMVIFIQAWKSLLGPLCLCEQGDQHPRERNLMKVYGKH